MAPLSQFRYHQTTERDQKRTWPGVDPHPSPVPRTVEDDPARTAYIEQLWEELKKGSCD